MAVTTSAQLAKYFDLYRDTEITFTKEIIKTLNLDPRQIYVKCGGDQWTCIINSTSLILSRIIVGTKGGAYAALSKNPTTVNLHFFFNLADGEKLSFYVTGRVTEVTPYMNSTDLAIVTITFTQRPPDDLIYIIGSMLEANANAIRRKEERIMITEESMRRIGISKGSTTVIIQNIPRQCVMRDISFSGSKIILQGIAQFIKDKETVMQISFEDPFETVEIPGKIVAAQSLEGRKDLVSANIAFDSDKVPMAFKLRINNYVTQVRKQQLTPNLS